MRWYHSEYSLEFPSVRKLTANSVIWTTFSLPITQTCEKKAKETDSFVSLGRLRERTLLLFPGFYFVVKYEETRSLSCSLLQSLTYNERRKLVGSKLKGFVKYTQKESQKCSCEICSYYSGMYVHYRLLVWRTMPTVHCCLKVKYRRKLYVKFTLLWINTNINSVYMKFDYFCPEWATRRFYETFSTWHGVPQMPGPYTAGNVNTVSIWMYPYCTVIFTHTQTHTHTDTQTHTDTHTHTHTHTESVAPIYTNFIVPKDLHFVRALCIDFTIFVKEF